MSLENRVLAEVFYLARMVPEWQAKPYWLMRRCIVPYIAARQFMLLRHEGLPIAFAGWVWEREGAGDPGTPWREDNYLPSASDFLHTVGRCCVTELISPLVPARVVMNEVAKWLKLDATPTRIEVNAGRKIMAVHPSQPTTIEPDRNAP